MYTREPKETNVDEKFNRGPDRQQPAKAEASVDEYATTEKGTGDWVGWPAVWEVAERMSTSPGGGVVEKGNR